MSGQYTPKTGDRVRVVLEGKVSTERPLSDSTLFWLNSSAAQPIRREHVVSVEKIADPLPTTPGSVVRSKDYGDLFFKTSASGAGAWIDYAGDHCGLGMRPASEYEVIFDAGKTA